MNNQEIILLDLFSGIGGFARGLSESGFKIKKHFFSEIDIHAISNYKHNFKNAQYIGSVTEVEYISGLILEYRKQYPTTPLFITFGSPCQDFSLAGKRMGLDGQRSSLIQNPIELIKRLRPDFFIWENVEGVFSSNGGADFWAVIKAFAEIGFYRIEWQLLNGAWFLPQNRERIYLIGHSTETGRSFKAVFPIAENNRRINERSIETTNVRTITAGGHSGGLHSSMTVVRTLNSSQDGKVFSVFGDSQTLSAGHGNVPKIEVQSATKSGYELAEIGDSINFSNPNSKTRRGRVGKGVAQTLDTQSNQCVIHQIKLGKSQDFKREKYDSNAYCIDTNGKDGIVIENNIRRLTEIECERLQGFDKSWLNGGEPENWTQYGFYPLIKLKKEKGDDRKNISMQDLFNELPNEEKIKIFDQTVKKQVPQTQRYKMCGNAVMVDCVLEIGNRIFDNYFNRFA